MTNANNHEVQHEVQQQKVWITLGLIATAYIAGIANIQGFLALLPLVQEEFFLTKTQVGLYSSFYFVSAIVMAVFSGKIVDHLGTKKGLVLGVSIAGFMMVLHAFAPYFSVLLFLAFFMGLTFSIVTPSANKAALELARPDQRSFFMGIVHSGSGIGGVIGATLLPVLGGIMGWRSPLIITGLFAVLVAALILIYYRSPEADHVQSHDGDMEITTLRESIGKFLQNRYLLSICLMGFVIGGSASTAIGHYTVYLTGDLGYSSTMAGICLGLIHAGGIVGQPTWGLLNEKLLGGDRRRGLILHGIIITALFLFYGLVISAVQPPPVPVMLLSFLFGYNTIGVIAVYFTTVGELAPKGNVGAFSGLGLVFPRTGMIVGPPVFGYIADFTTNYTFSWLFVGVVICLLTVVFWYYSGRYKPQS